MKLKALSTGIGELVSGGGDLAINHITHDSRKVQHGSIFVAIEGTVSDGHDYIGCAAQLGAVCVMTPFPEKVAFSMPILKVEEPRKAMAMAARRLYGYPDRKLKVVGVTGTNGKTTTTFMLNQILEPLGKSGRVGTLSYYNGRSEERSMRTTPESTDFYQILGEMNIHDCRYAAVEISSHGLVMNRVLGVELQYAIFTNLSQDHLDFHGTMEDYFQAKCRQFEMLRPGGTAVINWDDSYGRRIPLPDHVNLVRYGEHEESDLRLIRQSCDHRGVRFRVTYKGEQEDFAIPLVGHHNMSNVGAALAVGCSEGLSLARMAPLAARLRSVPGRCEMVELGQPFGVMVDFAHTPDALDKVLKACRESNPERLLVLFGAGGDRDPGKRGEMGEVVDQYADLVVLTSDNPRGEDPNRIMDMVAGGMNRKLGEDYVREVDRAQAVRKIIDAAHPGDMVLLAGKGHEATQEIAGNFLPFSDREEAAKAIQKRFGGGTYD